MSSKRRSRSPSRHRREEPSRDRKNSERSHRDSRQDFSVKNGGKNDKKAVLKHESFANDSSGAPSVKKREASKKDSFEKDSFECKKSQDKIDSFDDSSFKSPNEIMRPPLKNQLEPHNPYKHVSTPRPKISFGGAGNLFYGAERRSGFSASSRNSSFKSPFALRGSRGRDSGGGFGRGSFYQTRRNSPDSLERRNGSGYSSSAQTPTKNILILNDPTNVPRSRGYFEHDARDYGSNGRFNSRSQNSSDRHNLYDPRRESPSYHSHRRNHDNRSPANSRNFNSNRSSTTPKQPQHRFTNKRTSSDFFSPNRKKSLEGDWLHDKFIEMVEEESQQKKLKSSEHVQPSAEGTERRASLLSVGPVIGEEYLSSNEEEK